MRQPFWGIVVIALASGCARESPPAAPPAAPAPKPAQVDAARLTAAAADGANWLSYGRTYDEQRFSPLKQLDAGNVGELKLAWHFDLPDDARAQESTPLVIDGTLYLTGAWSKVFALDPASGKLLWSYDPHVPGSAGLNRGQHVSVCVHPFAGTGIRHANEGHAILDRSEPGDPFLQSAGEAS